MKTILTGLLILISQPGYALDNWQLVGNNKYLKVDIYYSIENSSNIRYKYVKILYNYFKSNNDLGHIHQSEIESLKMDCGIDRFQLIGVKWYSKKKGEGNIVFSTKNLDWINFDKDTAYSEVKNMICSTDNKPSVELETQI